MRVIPEKCIAFIKSFEGCRLKAYLDSVGVPTIGWGRTKGVHLGMEITREQADAYLLDELANEYGASVQRLVTVPIDDDQFSALVSFHYNTGALAKSTLLKKLNAGDFAGASQEFLKWDHAGQKVLPGLTRRREAERKMFLGED